MNKKKEIIRGHLTCTCDEAYKIRNMTDPNCFLCEYESEIELMMNEYAVQQCEMLVLKNRIINLWTGESTNPKVVTAKNISDLVNELKGYKWQANGVNTGEKQCEILTLKNKIMKYKIYSLEYPEQLQNTEIDGYHLKTISRAVFEDVNVGSKSEFDTAEEAYKHIEANAGNLKGCELCVLPVIKIGYNGKLI